MPRRISPLNDAIHHVVSKTDKTSKLDVKYINPGKGAGLFPPLYITLFTVFLGKWIVLKYYATSKTGRGVFSLASFSKGDFVVEYRGEMIDCAESQRRRRLYHNACAVYMFDFIWKEKTWCIDAAKDDESFGRLVNDEHKHPNCRMKKIEVDRKPHLCLFAVNDIKEGEEITYDYGGTGWPWRNQMDTEPSVEMNLEESCGSLHSKPVVDDRDGIGSESPNQQMDNDTAEMNVEDSCESLPSKPVVDDRDGIGSESPNQQMDNDTAEMNVEDSCESLPSKPVVDDRDGIGSESPNQQMDNDTAEMNVEDSCESLPSKPVVDDRDGIGSESPNQQMDNDTAEMNVEDSCESLPSKPVVDDRDGIGSESPNQQMDNDTAEMNVEDSCESLHSKPVVDDRDGIGSESPNQQMDNDTAEMNVEDSCESLHSKPVVDDRDGIGSESPNQQMDNDTAEMNVEDSYESLPSKPVVDDRDGIGSESPNQQSLGKTYIPALGSYLDFSESSDEDDVCVPRLRKTKSIIMKEFIPEDSDELFYSTPESENDYVPDSREESEESSSDESISLNISKQRCQSLVDKAPFQPTAPVPDSTTADDMNQQKGSIGSDVMGVEERPSTSSEKIKGEQANSNNNFEVEEGAVVVGALKKKSDGGRMYNKKHYCLFCFKPCSKIARHLEHVHSNESEVAKACCFPKGSKERKMNLDYIRNRGNYVHNVAVLKSGKGELIPFKQPREEAKANDFMHCAYCQGLFTRRVLWRHMKVCKLSPKCVTLKPGKNRVQSLCAFTQPVPLHISKELWKILSSMNHDDITTAVRNDRCIIQIGEHLLNRSGSSAKSQQCIRQKMRELGRLLFNARKVTSLRRMEDFIDPQHFMETIKAVKHTCGYDSETCKYKIPSLATKLGNTLVKLSKLLKAQALITNNKELVQKANDFQEVHKTRWNELVSATASRNIVEAKWNAPTVLPFTEDVHKLHTFLSKMQDECISQLSTEPSAKTWSDLAKVAMAQIILFNRRREGEVSSMALSAFLSRDNSDPHEDIDWALSEVEKKLCRHFSRIVIRGKRARPVPILLTPKMLGALELLVEKREIGGVGKDNGYMFARPSAMSHFRGSDCIRVFAKACGAKSPKALTSTKLRKQAATLSTVLNMSNTEMDQLANFLGHDIRIHREFYRLPEKTLQLAKISKVLMALEQGRLAEFQGKNLDEINIDPEEEIDLHCDDGDKSRDEGSCTLGLDEPAEEGLPPPDREVLSAPDSKCIPPTDRETSSLMSSVRSSSKGQKPTQKRNKTWEVTEVQAVERHMMHFITSCRVPGKEDCAKCLRAEPLLLKNRDWQNVKFYVYNRIVAYKRNM